MIEVGGKLKISLLLTSVAVFGVLAFSGRTSDLVKIKGEACEKFVPGQSRSSIRVRVTDKASYNAVSQIANLSEIRSNMLEHDFNVIVYNLVDNYVRDLMVRTTSQSNEELCVKVTGAIPVADIDKVISNYSPGTPAPEYDVKEAAGIEEEVLTEEDEIEENILPTTEAEVLYDGLEEEHQAQFSTDTEDENLIVYDGIGNEQVEEDREETKNSSVVNGSVHQSEEKSEESSDEEIIIEEDRKTLSENQPLQQNQKQNNDGLIETVTVDAETSLDSKDETSEQTPSQKPAVIEYTANVYVGPVEFNNNTHSSKPAQVLKDMFADVDGYRLVDNPQSAMYAFYPKVLKAKVDSLNSQTKRIQMVVSLQLFVKDSNISFSEHQNRFVLFESSEKEQEIAQKLLHKLLRKAGRKLFDKVSQEESKRKSENSSVLVPPRQ